MKNLNNFTRLQQLAEACKKDVDVWKPLMGYFQPRDDDDRKLLLLAAVAIGRLSDAVPQILTDAWGSQTAKQKWAEYSYNYLGIDMNGRVGQPVSLLHFANSGSDIQKKREYSNNSVTPPARQTWLPFTSADKLQMANLMRQLRGSYPSWEHRSLDSEMRRAADVVSKDAALRAKMVSIFDYADGFLVRNGQTVCKPDLALSIHNGVEGFWQHSMFYELREAKKVLNQWLWEEILRNNWEASYPNPAESKRKVEFARELGMGYGAGPKVMEQLAKCPKHDDALDAGIFLHEANKKGQQDYMDAQTLRKHWDSDLKNKKRDTTMNLTQKANAFFGNLKAIGGDLLRVQRGRATLHSAKRVIFAAMPIKWGFLARLTGKAKKVENHPLTDLALAFALHGATNFAISDVAKREKYLKYTEEMLVAAGYSASLKMLPVEDMLDKIFSGVGESEAVTKLKDMLKDEPEISVDIKK